MKRISISPQALPKMAHFIVSLSYYLSVSSSSHCEASLHQVNIRWMEFQEIQADTPLRPSLAECRVWCMVDSDKAQQLTALQAVFNCFLSLLLSERK